MVLAVEAPAVACAEDQHRVLERSFRAEKSRTTASGGNGLGVAICKSRSTPSEAAPRRPRPSAAGRGSKCRLPLARSESPARRERKSPASAQEVAHVSVDDSRRDGAESHRDENPDACGHWLCAVPTLVASSALGRAEYCRENSRPGSLARTRRIIGGMARMVRNVSWRFGGDGGREQARRLLERSCGNGVATSARGTDGCLWMTCSLRTCWRFQSDHRSLRTDRGLPARRSVQRHLSAQRFCRSTAATLIAWSSRSRLEPTWRRRRSRSSRSSRRPEPGRRDEDRVSPLERTVAVPTVLFWRGPAKIAWSTAENQRTGDDLARLDVDSSGRSGCPR